MHRLLFLTLLLPIFGLLAQEPAQPTTAAPCGQPELVLVKDNPPAQPAGKQPAKGAAKGRGYKPLTPAQRHYYRRENLKSNGARMQLLRKFQEPPPAFDCRDKGWCVPTWDQGSCGSCYLISTVRTMTCAFVKQGYGKPDNSFMMSQQYGMDCHNFGGCGGGNGTEVVDWAKQNGWIAEKYTDLAGVAHTDYPEYEASSSKCRTPSGAKTWKGIEWGYINGDGHFDVAAMKVAMTNYGVLNIALDAGGQFSSASSTITSMGRSIDHEICAVAYDDAKDGGAVLLSNQWGTGWGDGGYQWCTYKACANIVDWFWVSAAPLPPPPTVVVPNVAGLSVEEATGLLTTSHLLTSTTGSPKDTVVSQAPTAGTTVNTGSTVVLAIGTPPVPDVVLWSATFNRDWPKDKPLSLKIPVDIKKGSKLQLIGPAPADAPQPVPDYDDNPFMPDADRPAPMKKEKPCP